jgi:acyl-CoA synthetase (NDP forming)
MIPVNGLADAVDATSAFFHLSRPTGRRVCVISPPGGIAVHCADVVDRSGLCMSDLGKETRSRLTGILPKAGTSASNPVDMGFGAVVPGNLERVLEVVAADEAVDMIMVVGGAPAYREGDFGLMKMHSAEIRKASGSIDKPIVAIGIPSGFAFSYMSELSWAGIPCYQTPVAASSALSRLVSFYEL